ncbi:MAG TPA: SDR family NAD(P)-dependent oxidoreductase [Ilumatobacteraceae bacterium]|nr:SDR family NAD(P)-dependent oxidoreductase [Ilumatobacteraceae bacterium]
MAEDSQMKLSGLTDKVAIVTGAGRMRSIGRPIAVELARQGCDVVLVGTGRKPEHYPPQEQQAGWRDIDSVADEVRAHGRRATTAVTDISDADQCAALVDRVVDEYGRLDILVNNAGAARGDDRVAVVDLDPEVWRKVIDVNLTGSFLMSRAAIPKILAGNVGGSIVNISSIAGKMFGPNTAAYASSKAGLQALSAVMARELGPQGIRVNTICPGIIDTSRIDDMGRGEAWERTIQAMIPLRKAGTGEDIAYLTAYLCADEGSFVTGQAWNVDGGTVVSH